MAATMKIGVKSDIPAGEGRAYTCGNHRVAVFNVGGNFFAISDACPHAGGPLSDGWIDGTEVTCPWHGWTFDVRPCDVDPGDGVCRYPVHIDGDALSVEVPD
ncbi:MAG: Rieske 2Fe-2S domain-containing protein [Candidatus Hydrogenedentes bacterium]|nr:Rieske 2Fe-2S domain-containing protein [Candidatus Hydrogenedentota bacterium]